MSKNCDNWERLVEAVLRREQLREIALQDSRSPSTASDISYSSTPSQGGPFTHIEESAKTGKSPQTSLYTQFPKEMLETEDHNFSYDVEDLINSPAKLLGVGTFGATFKVELDRSTVVAVKKMKRLMVSKHEFEKQMQILATIRHENVVAVKTYFHLNDVNYLAYSYCNQPSISWMLHGRTREPPDWDTRLRIAVGTARGLAHIHAQFDGKLVHGNLRASNIFLNSGKYGCVSEHCLVTIGKYDQLPPMMNTGYHAPEVDSWKVSQASDVYSYGILLLELLTGKSPAHARISGRSVGLDTWVKSVSSKEGSGKLFESGLVKHYVTEAEMTKVLAIAMNCVAREPERRPKMMDIENMIGSIRNTGNHSNLKDGELEYSHKRPPLSRKKLATTFSSGFSKVA